MAKIEVFFSANAEGEKTIDIYADGTIILMLPTVDAHKFAIAVQKAILMADGVSFGDNGTGGKENDSI